MLFFDELRFYGFYIPYLKRELLTTYSGENNIINLNKILSGEICGQIFLFLENSGFIWINNFDIESDKLYIDLLELFVFIGNIMGQKVF